MPGSLLLPREVRRLLARWSADGHPREACGLLIGKSERTAITVARATLAPNLAERDDRYEVDPRHWIETLRRAEAERLEVVGVWHSHPVGTADPSTTDRTTAWPELVYVICSDAELRAFHLSTAEVRELGIMEAT